MYALFTFSLARYDCNCALVKSSLAMEGPEGPARPYIGFACKHVATAAAGN